MLDIEKAITFIGHASSQDELDDFLISSGIKRRLTAKDLPSAVLHADNGAVALQFTSSFAETYGPTKSDGILFLEDVTAQNPKFEPDVGPLTSPLPLGLRIDMVEQDIVNLLGPPTSSGEFLGANFLTYDKTLPNLSINIKTDLRSKEISFVRFMPLEP